MAGNVVESHLVYVLTSLRGYDVKTFHSTDILCTLSCHLVRLGFRLLCCSFGFKELK